MSSSRWLGAITSTCNGLSLVLARASGVSNDSVLLMRSRRSTSTASASRKMLASAWPAICARFGYSELPARGPAGSCMRPAPTTMMRCAPRCTAGEMGADWRIDPSPQYSSRPSTLSRTAGKTNGIADDAIRCATEIASRTASRCERSHGEMSLTVS